MKDHNRTLKRTALAVVVFHFIVVVLHSCRASHWLKRLEGVVAQLVEFLTNRDTEGPAKLLAANVVCVSDGGGEFFAARVPVLGRGKVALMLSKLFLATESFNSTTRAVELNGLLGVTTERDNAPPGCAGKVATLFQINDDGLIERIYFVLASRKLAALPSGSTVDA